MEIINYIISVSLIVLAILFKMKPNFIPNYSSLPQKKKDNYPFYKLIIGLFFTALITPLIAYNIRFGEYNVAANFSFLFTVPLGILITILSVRKKLKTI